MDKAADNHSGGERGRLALPWLRGLRTAVCVLAAGAIALSAAVTVGNNARGVGWREAVALPDADVWSARFDFTPSAEWDGEGEERGQAESGVFGQPLIENAQSAGATENLSSGEENEETADGASAAAVQSGDDTAQVLPAVAVTDLSGEPGGAVLLRNETAYNPDTGALLASLSSLPRPSAAVFTSAAPEPLVLIIHTHATECYNYENLSVYDPDTAVTRSRDTSLGVVGVGDAFGDELSALGIPTLHCRELFDAENYNEAYIKSAAAVRDYLEKYPSIAYVFDIHRDAITYSDSTAARPVAPLGGENAAQLMFVVGTDELGALHPDWQLNLALACGIQRELLAVSPTLARPINLRRASFNQQYLPGSLLVEVGSWGNSPAEAERAEVCLAQAFAKVIDAPG